MAEPTPPTPNESTQPAAPRRLPVRWQLIALGAGMLMIAVAVLFMLLGRPGGPQEEAPAVQTVQFVESQVFSEAIVGLPHWVNPLLAVSQADRDLASLVFSGLTRLDDYGQPVPDLAESWEVSEDGLTYTFTLRQGVTWHDGEPFTAEDVAFTMAILRDPDFPGPPDLAAFWRTVETYAEDDYTVRFVLTQPLTAFPEYAGIGVLPSHLLAGLTPAELAEDTFNLSPIGTGPFRWQTATLPEDDRVIVQLVPYDGFYAPERQTKLDELVLHFYENPGDAFGALGSEVQAMGNLSPAQLDAALESHSLLVYSARRPAYAAIIFNQNDPERLPFFQQEQVRQALTMALDRESIVANALPRQAVVAYSPILPGTWAYNGNLQPLPYSPEQAAQLLDEAGWVAGDGARTREEQELAFTLLVSNRDSDRAIGEAVVEQWRALGVDADLEVLEAEELLERLQTVDEETGVRDFDAALVEFGQGRIADPDPYPFWHESQAVEGQNYSGFIDHDMSRALEIARKDPNGVRRADEYRAFQQMFVERAAGIVLYNPIYHYAVSCQVQGVDVVLFTDPSDRFRSLPDWHIASAEEYAQSCPTE